MGALKSLFNWLSDYPRRQYTLGEVADTFKVPSLDYQIQGEDGYAPFNRGGRLLERTVTLSSLIAASFAASTGTVGYAEAVGIILAGKAIGATTGALIATYTSPM